MESIISDFDSIICLLKPLALVLFPFIFSVLFFSLLGLFGSILRYRRLDLFKEVF